MQGFFFALNTFFIAPKKAIQQQSSIGNVRTWIGLGFK